jgi:proline iminopeptidase
MGYCASTEFREALGRLTIPVLLVHGERDPRPMWAVERLAEALPDAELVRLAGVGHFPELEVPEKFRDVVRAFVRRVAGPHDH